MSLKGKKFEDKDIPRDVAHRLKTSEARAAWCASQTERYRIVAYHHETGVPFIAEELHNRAVDELSVKARRAVGFMMTLSPEIRKEIIAQFDSSGELIIPFRMVE